MKYTFFVLLQASPAWLQLPRERRRALAQQYLHPLLDGNTPLSMRFFDAEAFTAVCSDVMMIETPDPQHHYFFMEKLRDSPLISTPYFQVLQIVPAIEDGYVTYEKTMEA